MELGLLHSQQTFLVFQEMFKTSWRRLQGNNFSSSKTSWRRVCNTSSKNVFNTFSRRLHNVFKMYLQDVFKKTSSRRRLVIMSWRRLKNVLEDKKMLHWRHLQGVFSMSLPRRMFVGLSLFLKLPPRKLEPWFVLWSFFLLRLLCISINLPHGHAWNTVVMSGLVLSCYLELLDKLLKRVCRTVGPSLAASLEPLAHRRNVASLSIFYGSYFGRCSSELAWFHFLILRVGLLVILLDWMIFLSPFLDATKMSMSTVSFLAQLDPGILCLENAFLSPMI